MEGEKLVDVILYRNGGFPFAVHTYQRNMPDLTIKTGDRSVSKIHAEFLPNLNLLNLMLPSSLLSDGTDGIRVCDSLIYLSKRHTLQLPPALKWIKWTLSDPSESSQDDVVTLKLFVDPSRPWLESKDESELLLDAAALSPLTQIQCTKCSTPLLNREVPIARFHNTPSEYWHELTDCWACHKEDYSGLKGQKGGIVFAQENALLVATHYVILHPRNLDLEIVHTEDYKVIWYMLLILGILRSFQSEEIESNRLSFSIDDFADTILQHQRV